MAGSLTSVIRHPIYGKGQKVAYTGTAGSATFPSYSGSFMIWTTTIAYVKVGGTATTADLALPANAPIIIPTNFGDGSDITVSAIQDASAGNMYVIPLAE